MMPRTFCYPNKTKTREGLKIASENHVGTRTVQRLVGDKSTFDKLETNFIKRRKPVGNRWRMDETYIQVKGVWMYLYRTVDMEGKTIDFLLTKKEK